MNLTRQKKRFIEIKMTKEKKGKFIVLYGINNLGKSTQCKKIVSALDKIGIPVVSVKYADYNIKPSGHLLQNYLREGNKWHLSSREFQILQVVNRMQVEPKIRNWLERDTFVVAEDYIGTGIAWGMGAGVKESFLEDINSHLLEEDLAFLLEGERFESGIEKKHKHEQDKGLIERVKEIHLGLAYEKGWMIINANQDEEKVFADIWENIKVLL
jgi:dTMP kinase